MSCDTGQGFLSEDRATTVSVAIDLLSLTFPFKYTLFHEAWSPSFVNREFMVLYGSKTSFSSRGSQYDDQPLRGVYDARTHAYDLAEAPIPAFELLDLMHRSGCAQVLIGLESPTEAGLDGLELRSDWKRKRFPDYRGAIRNIQSHGITVNGCFVIGLDGHTPEIFGQVFDFVRETELYEVQITIITAFPGTPLYDRVKREGRILESAQWKKCTLFDVNYRPANMTPEQLADGFRQLAVKLYCKEFTDWRRGNFKKFLWAYLNTAAEGRK